MCRPNEKQQQQHDFKSAKINMTVKSNEMMYSGKEIISPKNQDSFRLAAPIPAIVQTTFRAVKP